jgi:hypothetical protein
MEVVVDGEEMGIRGGCIPGSLNVQQADIPSLRKKRERLGHPTDIPSTRPDPA